jgi:hypothetical protein
VTRVGSSAGFESYRAHSARDGKTQAENGFGGTAFSAIPTAHKGGRPAICHLKGTAILLVGIDGFAPGARNSACHGCATWCVNWLPNFDLSADHLERKANRHCT